MSSKAKSYKDTIHLPKTSFAMKAGLPRTEPIRLQTWEKEKLYERIRKASSGKPPYLLHDGPPYANGHIHMGHAFNKILKDTIVKFKTMRGMNAYYLPGWDCHGLPIEHALFQEMGKRKEDVPQVAFRRKARAYAEKYVSIQRDEFKRLGVFGEWDRPYLTMEKSYQAAIVASFIRLFELGYIEERLKPVPWCFDCETALAEAELEYEDKTSPSVYVKFVISDIPAGHPLAKWAKGGISFLVWTTTPWTLPANVALAVHPDLEYEVAETPKGVLVFASALEAAVSNKLGDRKLHALASLKGKQLTNLQTKHPFMDRLSKVVEADFVSSSEGTGTVHIAPGHGEEDYVVGLRYSLPVLSPVDAKGCFTGEFKPAEGELVHKANKQIIELLSEREALIAHEPYQHAYPHCWRCKNPVIFRATKQWFLKVDHNGLRRKLQDAIQRDIQFTPDWGKKRIGSMIETRPDWCLSRQRYWGVPIPVITCVKCGEVLLKESASRALSFVERESADTWFERPVHDFLPEGFTCRCGSREFEKESDIIDVWFDSGVSHQSVLKTVPELSYPADLYLEGSDQHRGWFQTALITGIALEGASPFKQVLTHGFVVDGEGKKMSKSRGNVVSPQEVMKEFGADVLRLWVASTDYQFDVRLSHEILNRTVEGYRRIRNTFRFLLGNLHDFDYKKDKVPFEQMTSVDRWALGKCVALVRSITQHYEAFAFHHVYRELQDFLVVDLSSFYLDIIKDRLYTAAANSRKRRSAQTTLYYLLRNLVKVLAPVLPFTTEEVWESTTVQDGIKSVHEADWPGDYPELIDDELLADWEQLLAVRNSVNREIEVKREAKEIGSPLEARIAIDSEDEAVQKLLSRYAGDLREALIVSQVEIENALSSVYAKVKWPGDGGDRSVRLTVTRAKGKKCERCWTYSERVGASGEFPTICERCIEALQSG